MPKPWWHWTNGLKWLGVFMAVGALALSLWLSREALQGVARHEAYLVSKQRAESAAGGPMTEARVRDIVAEELSKR